MSNEEKLLKQIVKSGKPKNFYYNGEKIKIDKKIIKELKKYIENPDQIIFSF